MPAHCSAAALELFFEAFVLLCTQLRHCHLQDNKKKKYYFTTIYNFPKHINTSIGQEDRNTKLINGPACLRSSTLGVNLQGDQFA